ncbi:MAG TPA: sugar phosphate nucleotidyltransferase [Candidatus Binatia bacterium]|jgi:mannose-1-phosphate guanylyltransferase
MRRDTTPHVWNLVLAGGDGTRLRELTARVAGAPIPKQYCRLVGDRSLLEATLDRINPLAPPKRTMAIVNRDHLPLARAQLARLPLENVVVQPSNRDTGPGLLLSLLTLARQGVKRVAVFPSDHYIDNESELLRHVRRAARLLDELPEKLMLLGIRPERAEPGLGYVESRGGVDGREQHAFHVGAFREKPSAADARAIVRRGGLWNSFIMVFEVGRVLELLRRERAEDLSSMEHALASGEECLGRSYAALQPWNFSRDFLARIPEHMVALRAERVGWSDWGTRKAIENTFKALGRTPPWVGNSRTAA